jgi:hypothetical protein
MLPDHENINCRHRNEKCNVAMIVDGIEAILIPEKP